MTREERIQKIMSVMQEKGVSGCYGLRYENCGYYRAHKKQKSR